MAVNITIHNSTTGTSRNITVDFIGGVLSDTPANACDEYYFKFSTSSTSTGGTVLPTKIVKNFTNFPLAGLSRSITCSGVAYTNIKDMINDYVYDFINGHTANQCATGTSVQLPMQF